MSRNARVGARVLALPRCRVDLWKLAERTVIIRMLNLHVFQNRSNKETEMR